MQQHNLQPRLFQLLNLQQLHFLRQGLQQRPTIHPSQRLQRIAHLGLQPRLSEHLEQQVTAQTFQLLIVGVLLNITYLVIFMFI